MKSIHGKPSNSLPFLLFLYLCIPIGAIPIDNGIAAQPEILCLQDSMRIMISTWKPFNGHMYVKGMFHSDPACHLDLTSSRSYDVNAVFNIPYRSCRVNRERSLRPAGLSYSTTVIIQFHHLFITKVDRAYRLTCFYMESDKVVTQGIHVSMIPTTSISDSRPMPTCKYEVLADSLSGPPVRFAKVGDKVYHKWTCESGIHGMLVHSCIARDDAGSVYELIDQKGCAIDPIALGDLTYSGDLVMAHAQVHVFKFADQMVVNFQCQISLCVKTDNGCYELTPPNCGPLNPYPSEPIPPPPQYPNPAPPVPTYGNTNNFPPSPSSYPSSGGSIAPGPGPYQVFLDQPPTLDEEEDEHRGSDQAIEQHLPKTNHFPPPNPHHGAGRQQKQLQNREYSRRESRIEQTKREQQQQQQHNETITYEKVIDTINSTSQQQQQQQQPNMAGAPDRVHPTPQIPAGLINGSVEEDSGSQAAYAEEQEEHGFEYRDRNGPPSDGRGHAVRGGSAYPSSAERERNSESLRHHYAALNDPGTGSNNGTAGDAMKPEVKGPPPAPSVVKQQAFVELNPDERWDTAPADFDPALFGGIPVHRTYRPPLAQVKKRDIPSMESKIVEGTLDVTSDDMIVFNLDDTFPASLSTRDGNNTLSFPRFFTPSLSPLPGDDEEVCMSRMVLIQIICGIILLFGSVGTIVAFYQRRYYMSRLKQISASSSSSSRR